MNYIHLMGAGVAGWLWGAAYYGILGKPWARALGWSVDDIKSRKMPLVPMLLAFVASLTLAFAIGCLIYDFGIATLVEAVKLAVAAAIGFIVTTTVVNNAFQRRSWAVTAIDCGHWIGVLVIQALIFMHFPLVNA